MSAPMMNNTRTRQTAGHAPTLSLHDPEFKNLITVPLNAVHHLPPAHLEISRLVLCRKYDPRDPQNSCPMGEGCKFVHLDMSTPQLTVQSIHVNYAYRSLDEVTHERLPAGETLAVMAPNNRAPSQLVPSEMILLTRGALNRHNGKAPNSHCAHYFYNRMCNRGERCGFLHCAFIDPSASEFQRAPPRAGASVSGAVAPVPAAAPAAHHQVAPAQVPQQQLQVQQPMVMPPLAHHMPRVQVAAPMQKTLSSSNEASSCDLSESPRSHTQEDESAQSTTFSQSSLSFNNSPVPQSHPKGTSYRHNPYSLLEVTLAVTTM